MALLIDPPLWRAHGRGWSHLVSDTSIDELHAFARGFRLPARAFEGDHYDIPDSLYDAVVAAGAREVSSHELLRALQRSGLRLQKRVGEKGIERVRGVTFVDGTTADVDLIASPKPAQDSRVFASMVFLRDAEGSLVVVHSRRRGQWGSPGGWREGDESVAATGVREVREETGLHLDESDLEPCGYERFARHHAGGGRVEGRDLLQCFRATLPARRPRLAPDLDLDDTTDRRWVTPQEYAAMCGGEFWWPLAREALGLAAE